eukprot:gene13202-15596_t
MLEFGKRSKVELQKRLEGSLDKRLDLAPYDDSYNPMQVRLEDGTKDQS